MHFPVNWNVSITYQVIDLPVFLNGENLAPELHLDMFQEPNSAANLEF